MGEVEDNVVRSTKQRPPRAFRQLVLVERHHTHVISRSRPSLK